MTTQADSHAFNRIIGIHKPDCELLSHPNQMQEVPLPDEDDLLSALGSDRSAEYALTCRGIYEDLRRVIGQLAGLMILARLTRKIEFVELEQVDDCSRRLKDAADRIRSLKAPGPLAHHKQLIEAAHDICGQILRTFPQVNSRADLDQIFDEMGEQIKRAYSYLSQASSHEAGMVMVDFSNACCSCGQ